MRTYCFTFNTEEDTKKTFDQLFALFKDCRDFKEKKILFAKTVENNENKIYLSIEDAVAGSYSLIISNAFDKVLSIKFVVVKAECNNINVELPGDVKIATYWAAEESKDGKTN